MNIDQFGRVFLSETEAFNALYSGKIPNLEKSFLLDPNDQFNNSVDINRDLIPKIPQADNLEGIDISQFDMINQHDWFMPDVYKNMDIKQWVSNQCQTEEQQKRVEMELKLFDQFQLRNLLCYLKYLVDTMRANNIVWGIGRGSCVSSYVLYLIGVHKIDSIKYSLDINEFLK